MKKTLKRKTWQFWLTVFSCLVISATLSFSIFSNWQETNQSSISETTTDMEFQGDPLRPVNFLILGHDGDGRPDDDNLTDTMLFARVIPREERVILMSIPRDLWVRMPFEVDGEYIYRKINHAYAIGMDEENYLDRPDRYRGAQGGANLAMDVVEMVIGEAIDFYVVLGFDAFINGFNTLAGSDGLMIDVPFSFVDHFYPIAGMEYDPCGFSEAEIANLMARYSGTLLERQFTCRYETIIFTQGRQSMTAEEALKFVRSRHSLVGGNDFGRSMRQQALIASLVEEVLTPAFLLRAPGIFLDLSRSVETNIGIGYVTTVLTSYGNLRNFEIENFVLSNANLLIDEHSHDGQAILVPRVGDSDFSEIQEFLIGKTASGSAVLDEFNF
ncbi:MAG: LCP family protein [Pseudomonadales bacterium]|jgi:anionic cell wall polymer biosynthesis LytR-Cps2A-Psr (LCP) family protein|nr:LCP family protein [Pseudomonadales bacterium]